MLFERALQLIDATLANFNGTRQQHFELQQAVKALQDRYNEAMSELEKLQTAQDETKAYRD